MMKKSILIMLGVVIVIVFALYRRVTSNFNNLVALDEGVQQSWSQVENQYQRRADLIPRLVETVKGFADQEFDVLTEVTQARAAATQTTVDINDAQSMAQFQSAQGDVSSALSRLLVTVEAYPDIKSNQNFLELQVQLEGTENRIATERGRYNTTVQQYNTTVRRFPTNVIANIFGFDRAELFTSQEGAEVAPEVDFDFSNRGKSSSNESAINNQIEGAVNEVDQANR